MATRKKRFSGLFFNAVLALSLITLVPLVLIGLHLTRVNSRLLQHEIFQREQAVAGRLSGVVQSHITHLTEFFNVFLDLHTDFGGHAFLNQLDLKYLLEKNSAISSLSLLNKEGKTLLTASETASPEPLDMLWPQLKQVCLNQRKDYFGPVSFTSDGGWLSVLGFPVYENLDAKAPDGVLVAWVSLRGLGTSLAQVYPLEMEIFVVNEQQKIVAYNGAPEGLMSSQIEGLDKQVQAIITQLGDNVTGEVTFPNKRKWLVASAGLSIPGWKIYVAQPANVATKLVIESTLHSAGGILRIILIVIIFILGVSYWVIIPITRPLERLRKAAMRLQEGDVVIKREDVDIPPNEIGDLAEVFVQTSESLHSRREELLSAQRQLAHSNQELEKRVEERTRELKEAGMKLVANERLATMGQMASIISHEIRNPLAVISNATRLIKMLVKEPDSKLEKQFGIIEAEIKQANSIISEVLGYVRSREPILNKVEVNSYVHDILNSYPLPEGIEIKEEFDVNNVYVKIDMEEMKQALRNLLANAAEAMQGQGTLTVGTKIGREMVCIYVMDTGPGVPEDIRQKIFAPFYTTKARGTGLGLAVVGKAVNRHQGKIFVSSREGKGACFQIYLKIYQQLGDTRYGEIG